MAPLADSRAWFDLTAMERFRDLVVSEFGSSLHKKSERIQLRRNGQVDEEVPLFHLRQIVVQSRGVTISTDALETCVRSGVQIHFLGGTGAPYATLVSPELGGTIQTRRQQLAAYEDERGVELVKCFATGKLQNQSNLLKYVAKYRKQTDLRRHGRIRAAAQELTAYVARLDALAGDSVDDVRQALLTLEAHAGQAYWRGFGHALDAESGFERRETRGATDLVNQVLNYGYGVLYSQVQSAVLLAGLDPYAGFLHVDRPGKPSLVLDLIEEFRQPVVDRVVLAALNRGASWKTTRDGLDVGTRRDIAHRVRERLRSKARYQGHEHTLDTILQRQARRVATFVRGERDYRPFITTW